MARWRLAGHGMVSLLWVSGRSRNRKTNEPIATRSASRACMCRVGVRVQRVLRKAHPLVTGWGNSPIRVIMSGKKLRPSGGEL